MFEKYVLDVVSQHPEFKGRALKKYSINGVDTVGAFGNEPFEINFHNRTGEKVQVKLSIDGTDILTGKPADTSATGEMWQVQPYAVLRLKAWPESNKGGAAFLFTSAEKSVAVNTHGDLSSRGVIAAAVFYESFQPASLVMQGIRLGGIYPTGGYGGYSSSGGWGGTFGSADFSKQSLSSGTASQGILRSCNAITNSIDLSDSLQSASLESLAAVGAGQHVDQNITKITGFTMPALAAAVKIRYEWWDDLVTACKQVQIPATGSGFPGDERRIMNLGTTPRQGEVTKPIQTTLSYSRF